MTTQINNWSNDVLRECAHFLLGDVIGEGMSRTVYQHPTDESKVIKVENNAHHFQNVKEWMIWNEFYHEKDVSHWLAPCHAISDSGTFLIMDKAIDLSPNKKIEKLPFFLTDHKRENFGMIGRRIVCRDYGLVVPALETTLRKWQGE